MESFNDQLFEQKLIKLKDSHDSISKLSSWCLANQQHHDRIVAAWLAVLKRVRIEQRVVLFYLANDIVQYSKKKMLPFVDTFAPAFQKAVTMVREENVRAKLERLFAIWKQRGIYEDSFLMDLNGLLSRGKTNRIDINDFQPSMLYSRIKSCNDLEDDTDIKLKVLTNSHMSLTDIEKMRNRLKERNSGVELIPEVEDGIKKIKQYIKALEAEIKERVGLVELLETSELYYADQLKEAKIVVNAYKCFGGRIKGVNNKLPEKLAELRPLTPDVNAPSPSLSPETPTANEISLCGMTFSSGGSFMDGSLLADDYLALKNDLPEVTSSLSKKNLRDTTSSSVTSVPVSSLPSPHAGLVSSVSSLERLPPVSDTVSTNSVSNSCYLPPIDGQMNYNHAENYSVNNSPLSTEGKKIEVVTRTQTLQNMSLSDLLQSLIPHNNSSSGLVSHGGSSNEGGCFLFKSKPHSPAPQAINIKPTFTAWPESQSDNWESSESPPSYENKEYSEDIGISVYGEEDNTADESMDVDHRNLISLTGGCDTDFRSVLKTDRDNQDNVENIDMDLSDDDEKMSNFNKPLIKSPVNILTKTPTITYEHNSFPPKLPFEPSPPPSPYTCTTLNTTEVTTTPLKTNLSVPPPLCFSPQVPPPITEDDATLQQNRLSLPVHFCAKLPPPLPPPPLLPTNNRWNRPNFHFPPPYIVQHNHGSRRHSHPPFRNFRPPYYRGKPARYPRMFE